MPYIGKQRAQGISGVRRKKPFVGKRQMRRRVNISVATFNRRDDMNTVIAGDIVELDRYAYCSTYLEVEFKKKIFLFTVLVPHFQLPPNVVNFHH